MISGDVVTPGYHLISPWSVFNGKQRREGGRWWLIYKFRLMARADCKKLAPFYHFHTRFSGSMWVFQRKLTHKQLASDSCPWSNWQQTSCVAVFYPLVRQADDIICTPKHVHVNNKTEQGSRGHIGQLLSVLGTFVSLTKADGNSCLVGKESCKLQMGMGAMLCH